MAIRVILNVSDRHYRFRLNISYILEFVSGTTIYCGRSLAAKIITSE